MITEVLRSNVHRRWFGTIELKNGLVLYTSGSVASWFFEGDKVEVIPKTKPKDVLGRKTLFFDDYDLFRIYGDDRIKVWDYFKKEVVLRRTSFGREVYSYRILAREAVFEKDFEAIAELEQYHYASQKSKVALWKCESCNRLIESNIKPECDCGGEVHIVEIKGSTPASRFLVFELKDKQPYEPDIVAYVRVDPPVPLMHRRIGSEVVKNIREKVFPKEWFERVYSPEEEMKELFSELRKKHSLKVARHRLWELASRKAMEECNTGASRIARVVVHPDYRADGIGKLAVEVAVEWIAERRVPEMRMRKHLVETIAQMARFNPFFEKAGFYYVWETASGKPVLYKPITEEAKKYIEEFLKSDEEAKKHGGKLCVSRFGKVVPMKKLKFEKVSKVFSTVLDLERVEKDVRFVLESFGVKQRVVERYIFRELNFEIKPGEIIAVVGASGAGKTTLLKMILGLEEASGGSVEVEAEKVVAVIPGDVEPEIGEESVIEQVYKVCGDIYLAVEILNLCGISDAVLYRAKYKELSTGQKERFKLAMCLAEKPSLLLVDEFAAHLDEVTAMRVARKLADVARRAGITIVAVTHRKEVISALSPDRVFYVGYGGVVVEDYLR